MSVPGRYVVAIAKLEAHDEEPRFVYVNAASAEHAKQLVARRGLIDPKTEGVVGVMTDEA